MFGIGTLLLVGAAGFAVDVVGFSLSVTNGIFATSMPFFGVFWTSFFVSSTFLFGGVVGVVSTETSETVATGVDGDCKEFLLTSSGFFGVDSVIESA